LNDKHKNFQTQLVKKDNNQEQMNILKNINDTHILKYKYDIEDILKHVCYCCEKLCFKHQLYYASQS
jgi:hypothetical protein